MICYRNVDPQKNIGLTSGKKFVIFFKGKSSFYLFEDGTTKLAKKDSYDDLRLLEIGVLGGIIEKFEVL
jgi:hypothetical protein